MTTGSPAAEVDITEALVRKLLQAQHADLADLPLEFAGEGWDNVMVRLGEDLALRLPRRGVADQLLRNEQRWLPEIAPDLPLPVPVPLRTGQPQDEYPYAWSVLRWIEGETADLAPPDASEAPILAHFLKALHQLAPDEAPDSDVCAGDPASDLASVWGLFESADARRTAIDTYGMSDATLARARGWAVFYGVILLETGRHDHPRHAKMGADTLRRLSADLT